MWIGEKRLRGGDVKWEFNCVGDESERTGSLTTVKVRS